MSGDTPMSNDLASIGASIARIDERTQGMAQGMQRIETSLNDHKSATDKRFDGVDNRITSIEEKKIEPLKDRLANMKVWLALSATGGGAAGALAAEKLLKLIGM